MENAGDTLKHQLLWLPLKSTAGLLPVLERAVLGEGNLEWMSEM